MAFFTRFSSNVTKTLLKQVAGIIGTSATSAAEAAGIALKKRLLDKVRQHPICREITELTLPSSFVKSKSGTATLRGFLGFDQSEDPVENLIDFLDRTILIKPKRRFILGQKIITSLSIPSKADMNSASELLHPRLGIAWPIIIEDGLSGFASSSFFLQTPPARRGGASGLGIQIKGKTRDTMGKVPFLSQLFKEFREQFGGK